MRPIDPVAAVEKGSQILIAGVPVQGIEPNRRFLRGSRCQAEGTSDVLEGGWLWHDSQVSDCEGILGGSWGSPSFNPAGEAVAMVNTTTIGSEQVTGSAPGRPCQVSADGVVSVKQGASSWFRSRTSRRASLRRLTLGGQCPLEDPASVLPAKAVAAVSTPGRRWRSSSTGDCPRGSRRRPISRSSRGRWARWTAVLLKGGKAQPQSTRLAPTHSTRAVDLPSRPPPDEGFTLVCVGSAAQPTEVVIKAANTAPNQ